MTLSETIADRITALDRNIEFCKQEIMHHQRRAEQIEHFYAADIPIAHRAVLANALANRDPVFPDNHPVTKAELLATSAAMVSMYNRDLQTTELKKAALESLARVNCDEMSELFSVHLKTAML